MSTCATERSILMFICITHTRHKVIYHTAKHRSLIWSYGIFLLEFIDYRQGIKLYCGYHWQIRDKLGFCNHCAVLTISFVPAVDASDRALTLLVVCLWQFEFLRPALKFIWPSLTFSITFYEPPTLIEYFLTPTFWDDRRRVWLMTFFTRVFLHWSNERCKSL